MKMMCPVYIMQVNSCRNRPLQSCMIRLTRHVDITLVPIGITICARTRFYAAQ